MTHQHHDACCEHEHHKCCEHEHHHEHNHEHHHEHHHEHGGGKQLTVIVLTIILLALAVVIEHNFTLPTWQLLLVYLVPYLLIGHDTLKEAAEGIASGNAFNEHLLMSIATLGALAIGFLPGAETEFPEAVFVMLFFQIGELFEGYAEGKSRTSISHLMNIRPDVAHVLSSTADLAETTGDDSKDVNPEEVAIGSTILVRPGERIPLDGVVLRGQSALNTVALTGESLPRDVAVDDEVTSGCVNLSGVLYIRTTKSFGDSTVSKIIDLVEHAAESKSKSETFITRFARIYTPIVVAAAILLAVVPPVVSLLAYQMPFAQTFSVWLYRALTFLVVSCPCALVISIPLTFFGGIGGASRRGILIKGSTYMDVLAKVDTVVFDKTGTLTRGQFAVTAVHSGDDAEHEGGHTTADAEHRLLHLAAHVEHFSTHPIGAALRDAFPDEATDGCQVSDVEEIAGQGIRARVGNDIVCVGNPKMMEAIGAKWIDCTHVGTIIHVAINNEYAGHIVINDQVKDDSAAAVSRLKALGISRTVMLTGDRENVAADVARQLQLTAYHAELMPADKVGYMDQLRTEGDTSTIAFVGDGINDAPVLARADVGIAMGGLGSDAAIEAADVVLMDDHPSKIATAISIARRTIAIAHQNVCFAIGIKAAVLLLAAVGLSTMWMAVFADVGVTVIAVLNAMRTLRVPGEES